MMGACGFGTTHTNAQCPLHSVCRPARKARAVSYTHLRAHETVLDLVCRLLLEKKNIYTS